MMKATVIESRVAAAIKGALLADAACMGSDGSNGGDAPEFQDPPSPVGYSSADYPGHYDKPGMPSPWGEQFLFALSFVAREKGVNAGPMSVALMKWVESDHSGYKDPALDEFLTCMKAGDRSVELCGHDDDRGMYAIIDDCQLICPSRSKVPTS
jgi:hypothetical protein